MDNQEQWKVLGKAARARRMALGYRYQPSFVESTGIGKRTLSAIENGNLRGRADFDPATRHRLETGLRWAPGSIDRILAGGEPIELPPPAAPDAPLSKLRNVELVARITEDLAELVRRLPNEMTRGKEPLIAGVNAPYADEVPTRRVVPRHADEGGQSGDADRAWG